MVFADRGLLIKATAKRLKDLTTAHQLRANQILLVNIGIPRPELEAAVRREGISLAQAGLVYRFPLTPKDLRIVVGTPDEVQGLEAEAVVVVHWQEDEIDVGRVRDLYIAASRARSLLITLSNVEQKTLLSQAEHAFQQIAAGVDGDDG